MNKQRRYEQRMKARGLCAHCGKPALPGLTMCEVRREGQYMSKINRDLEKIHPLRGGEVMYQQYGMAWLEGCEHDDEQVRRLTYATRSRRYKNAAV